MANIITTSNSTSSSQGSTRLDEPTKNEVLALKMRQALEIGMPQPTDSDTDDWSSDGWDDEPLSPETTKKWQDIFAKNAAKLAKASASRKEYSIFG
jgi:hypothetical protein